MAKPKRSADDLDAELAALEAELAQLGQKKPKPKKSDPEPATAPAPAEAEPAPAPAEGEAAAKGAKPRFGLKLPKLGKRGENGEAAAASPARAPEPAAAAPASGPAAAPPMPKPDASLWRQEEGAWVRTVPGEPVVLRRVLDEEGRVVREEPASARDLEEETPMKAERGIGKLFRRRSG